MAKILPFPPTPRPPKKAKQKPSPGLSYTLKIDAKELAEAVVKRLQGEGLTDSDTEE